MKEIFETINKLYFKGFTNICWTEKYPGTNATMREIYEYFNKTKEDMVEDFKYEYELNEGIPFDEILMYNPYKFKKNMRPDEIDLLRYEASDKISMGVVEKYFIREYLTDDFKYDTDKIAKADESFKDNLYVYIKEIVNDDNKKMFGRSVKTIENNDELQKYFPHSDMVIVNNDDKIIYLTFNFMHLTSSVIDVDFKRNCFLYDERYFVEDEAARKFVEKEEKRIRLENNGPEHLDNETFANWIGRGYNDEALNEYYELFIHINVGGMLYLKNCIEAIRQDKKFDKYQDYRVYSNIVKYNPLLGDKAATGYYMTPVYMNTDFSQIKELKDKYK